MFNVFFSSHHRLLDRTVWREDIKLDKLSKNILYKRISGLCHTTCTFMALIWGIRIAWHSGIS